MRLSERKEVPDLQRFVESFELVTPLLENVEENPGRKAIAKLLLNR